MFYQTFLSPQVKRCAIITYKYGMYELLHELSNDLRLDIRKLGNTRKLTKLHRMIAERPDPPLLPTKMKAPPTLEENS